MRDSEGGGGGGGGSGVCVCVCAGGDGDGRVTVPEIKPDSTVVYAQHMERSERERQEGQKQCHYLNVSPPACLDRQDLHVGFSAGAPGVGWGGVEVGGNSHLHGAQGVAALGTGLFFFLNRGLSQNRPHIRLQDTRSQGVRTRQCRVPVCFFLCFFSLHNHRKLI